MAQPLVEGTVEDDANIVATESSILAGYSGDDNLTGSAFSDQLFGGHSEWREGGFAAGYVGPVMVKVGDNDSIFGGAGDDFIMVGTGTDTIDGGDNYDQINFQFDNKVSFVKLEKVEGSNPPMQRFREFSAVLANVFVDLETGTYNGAYWAGNTRVGTANGTVINVESVIGSIGNDTINGSSADNAFKPIGGDDTIDGRGGFDILSYDDLSKKGILLDYQKRTVIDGFGGTDRFSNIEIVIGSKNDDTMLGSGANERFTGNKGADEIDGGGGKDTVDYSWELGKKGIVIDLNTTGVNKDTFGYVDTLKNIERIVGTKRNDVIEGSHKVDETFWGREGDDKLYGYGGDDTLWGGAGNDRLDGSGGYDVLKGEDGNDTIFGGDDDDRIDGGNGDDTIEDTSIDFEPKPDKPWDGNTVKGGSGNDTMKVLGLASGGDGNDTIFGQGRVSGDAGDDTIRATLYNADAGIIKPTEMLGGDGNDKLYGGPKGVQGMASYDYASVGIDAHMDTGMVNVTSTDRDTLVDVFYLSGSRFGDAIFGTGKADHIWGSDGNDTITAKGGDDVINGEGGNDSIDGGSGENTLIGGEGNDTIRGGSGEHLRVYGQAGEDTLYMVGKFGEFYGGAGNDTFIGDGSNAGLAYGDAGSDTILAGAGAYLEADGGAGSDLFVVTRSAKQLFVHGFASGKDEVDLTDFGFASFSALKKLASNKPGLVTLQLDADTSLVIYDLDKSDLRAADFIL